MIDVDLIDHDSSCSKIGGPISPNMEDCPWISGFGNVHNCQVSKFKSTMATTFSIFVGFSS